MLKRILIGASSAAFLTLGACDALLETESSCVTIQNNTQRMAGDTVVTTTGLRYIDTRVGTGATARTCQDLVVDYELRLLDGTVADPGQPFGFTPGVSNVIQGFSQGVIGMKVGGTRRVIVPPALGYGSQPYRDIPGNSTLVFDLELLEAD